MGGKDIKENQGKMNIILLKISGKIREIFHEILVATLNIGFLKKKVGKFMLFG